MDVLNRIQQLKEERSWTQYRLSLKSGIPTSDISVWNLRGSTPNPATVEKLCKGFEISMSEFYIENPENVVKDLTPLQFELVESTAVLSTEQRIRLNSMVETLSKTKLNKNPDSN